MAPPPQPTRPDTKRNSDGVHRSINEYPTPSPSPPQSGQDFMPTSFQANSCPPAHAQHLHRPAAQSAHSTLRDVPSEPKPKMPWEMHSDPTVSLADIVHYYKYQLADVLAVQYV